MIFARQGGGRRLAGASRGRQRSVWEKELLKKQKATGIKANSKARRIISCGLCNLPYYHNAEYSIYKYKVWCARI